MNRCRAVFLCFGIIFSCSENKTNIEIAPLFSDGMVLQRNSKVNIWGKSLPYKSIIIISEWGNELKLRSDSSGNWKGALQTPENGGPFSMEIISENDKVTIGDVLIGEVWLASGQSNMEMSFKGYPPKDTILNSKSEIENSNFPNIRMFNVGKHFSTEPTKKLSGSWMKASPENVEEFSSTAYFFARELYYELNIPIGIIHSSWGGSPAESWTSETKLKELGIFLETLNKINNSKVEEIKKSWFEQFDSIDAPKQQYPDDRMEVQYKKIEFSDQNMSNTVLDDEMWQNIILPGRFDSIKSMEFDGAVWLRKEIFIEDLTNDYTLNIGYIDDMDITFFNGKFVGGLSGFGHWNKKREYKIPRKIIKKGENIIAIRAIDIMGPGRIAGLINLSGENGEIISLEGNWKYKPVAELYENKFYIYEIDAYSSSRPSFIKLNPFLPKVLFNGMINPLIPYSIKGAIWYQGESNVGRHKQYADLFPGMIDDWRSSWGKEFSFYFVQIAPFNYIKEPGDDVSQKLREVQRKALRVKKTGMVVTLDIGDFDNIHPSNKQDVGKRLARLALVNDYDMGLYPLGPILIDSQLFNDSIRIEFEYVGSGLSYQKGKKNQFEIADSSMRFFDANISIDKNYIFVSSQFVKNPKYVRYGWSDTPEATLFNSERLPASSFMIEIE
tara:strand:+ start:7564 stop:9570 length:2007 start_codon:yes stop_codon:yes gene_type:complete